MQRGNSHFEKFVLSHARPQLRTVVVVASIAHIQHVCELFVFSSQLHLPVRDDYGFTIDLVDGEAARIALIEKNELHTNPLYDVRDATEARANEPNFPALFGAHTSDHPDRITRAILCFVDVLYRADDCTCVGCYGVVLCLFGGLSSAHARL